MGKHTDERPGYREFFFEKAGEAVFEWLQKFCRSHSGFCLGTFDDGKYRFFEDAVSGLPAESGSKFCLFRMADGMGTGDSGNSITDIYGIDVSGLFMISGTQNCFDLVFRNGNVYSFDDGSEKDVPGPVKVSCVNDRDLMMRIYKDRDDFRAIDFEKERIPLSFDHFMTLLKNRMTDLDEWLRPEVNEDGSIDLVFSTLYGHHTMYTISPRGQLYYHYWTGTEYKEEWQSAFDSVIELTDLPVYQKRSSKAR